MKVPAIKVSFVNEPNKQVALLQVSSGWTRYARAELTCVAPQEEAAIMVALKDVVCGFLRSHGFLGDKNDVQGSPEKSISSPVKRLKQAPVPVRRSTPIAVPDLPLPEDVPPVSQLGSPSAAARASVIFERGPSSTIEQKTVVSSSKGSLKKASDGKKGNYQQLIDIKYLKRSDRSTHPDEKPAWLQEALTDWSNPVFPPVQKQIRTVETGPTSRPETFHTEIPCDATNRSTIDKEMLHWCNYVAQIDLKFLLFSYITEQSMTLILIDQHAAHERIRVESFLRTYCEQIRQKTVNMVHLSQAKVILLAAREVVELSGMPGCLSQWGFEVSIPMQILDRSDSDYSQVIVKSVPALLADRLVTDDRLLQTILRALLSQEEDPDSEIRLNRKLSWIAMIRNMPSALIDLINSKACRGACSQWREGDEVLIRQR